MVKQIALQPVRLGLCPPGPLCQGVRFLFDALGFQPQFFDQAGYTVRLGFKLAFYPVQRIRYRILRDFPSFNIGLEGPLNFRYFI